ncbi:MAG: hypothetical protein GY940_45090 [bacterium]|nr:hypothetical protein [bacterium]
MTQMLTTLKQVISNIFGDMFFMFPDEYEPGDPVDFPRDWIKYRIEVLHEKGFVLNCYFTPNQAVQMAENFLGEAVGKIGDDIIDGMLKEAVNVFGGNLLNRLNDSYHLGLPVKSPTGDIALLKEAYDREEAVLLNVEDQPFMAIITDD